MKLAKTCSRMLAVLVMLPVAASTAAEVAPAVEIAPRAEGTRYQRRPAAAWSEDAKCWLVAWREGFLNETVSDVWCARVAAGGKALDPAGIRLTTGKGLKDCPRVASDGKDFLVVWEDLSNGKDWDVRGARVSGEGKILDERGVLLAGGARNQCHPAVAFAAGNYLVFWQGMTGTGHPGDKGTGYAIYSARVSRGGRALDRKGVAVAPLDGYQHCWPVACAHGESVLVSYYAPRFSKWGGGHFGGKLIDPRTGQSRGALQGQAEKLRSSPFCADCERQRFPAAAVGKDGILAAIVYNQPKGGLRVYNIGPAGDLKGDLVISPARVTGFPYRYAIAFDGERYLLVTDSCAAPRGRGQAARPEIRAWRFGADGKPIDEAKTGFVISSDPGKGQAEPAVSAGPRGVCLVAYYEVRGVDDVKVMARVVGRPSAAPVGAAPAAPVPAAPAERPEPAAPERTESARAAAAPAGIEASPAVVCRGWLSLAMSYKRAGRADKAREYLKRIVDEYPETEFAARARQELAVR